MEIWHLEKVKVCQWLNFYWIFLMQHVVRCCTVGKLLFNLLFTEFDWKKNPVTLSCLVCLCVCVHICLPHNFLSLDYLLEELPPLCKLNENSRVGEVLGIWMLFRSQLLHIKWCVLQLEHIYCVNSCIQLALTHFLEKQH